MLAGNSGQELKGCNMLNYVKRKVLKLILQTYKLVSFCWTGRHKDLGHLHMQQFASGESWVPITSSCRHWYCSVQSPFREKGLKVKLQRDRTAVKTAADRETVSTPCQWGNIRASNSKIPVFIETFVIFTLQLFMFSYLAEAFIQSKWGTNSHTDGSRPAVQGAGVSHWEQLSVPREHVDHGSKKLKLQPWDQRTKLL